MLSLSEYLAIRMPKLFTSVLSANDDKANDLEEFGTADRVKLDRYYSYWRGRIRQASNHNSILTNGWAFSTLAGLSDFETRIHSDKNLHKLYFDRIGEIDQTVDEIFDALEKRKVGGIILYGYGNLLRETFFVEKAVTTGLFNNARIYLLDCSLFYHIFAQSPINPLRQLLRTQQIKPKLIDFLEDISAKKKIKYIRDDLNPMRPVLHFFLGNTFCNTEQQMLLDLLENAAKPGDIVISEYAIYTSEFFQDASNSHITEMSRHAVSELFSVDAESVKSTEVAVNGNMKFAQISFHDNTTTSNLTFKSMLRREFQGSELTNGPYQLISSHVAADRTLKLDAFLRL